MYCRHLYTAALVVWRYEAQLGDYARFSENSEKKT
jgi:hypothetical protein